MLDYLATMTRHLVDNRACERNGVDQGVHNVMVGTGEIATLVRHRNENGPVLHLQQDPRRGLGPLTDEQGDVANESGKRVAVAHQYDRSKPLKAHFFKRYAIALNGKEVDAFMQAMKKK
jgi:hypothetical protein